MEYNWFHCLQLLFKGKSLHLKFLVHQLLKVLHIRMLRERAIVCCRGSLGAHHQCTRLIARQLSGTNRLCYLILLLFFKFI